MDFLLLRSSRSIRLSELFNILDVFRYLLQLALDKLTSFSPSIDSETKCRKLISQF